MQGAVLSYFIRYQLNYPKAVDGTAEDRIARHFVNGKRFAGEDCLIDGGVPAHNSSVNRDGFSGQDTQTIPFFNLFCFDQFLFSAPDAPSLLGRKGDQCFQATLGAPGCFFFENGSNCHDECNLACREQIADCKGGDHGDRDGKAEEILLMPGLCTTRHSAR